MHDEVCVLKVCRNISCIWSFHFHYLVNICWLRKTLPCVLEGLSNAVIDLDDAKLCEETTFSSTY